MTIRGKRLCAAAALLAIFAAAPASAHIRPLVTHAGSHMNVVRVHQNWRDEDGGGHRDGYASRRNGHVHAPFTHVDARYRSTGVDAPFAVVRTSRRGVWVRAPFVNLFVPR